MDQPSYVDITLLMCKYKTIIIILTTTATTLFLLLSQIKVLDIMFVFVRKFICHFNLIKGLVYLSILARATAYVVSM